MKKSLIHLFIAILVLSSFSACDKQAASDIAIDSADTEESGASEVVVEAVKEDLKQMTTKLEAEAKQVVDSVKEASAANIEVAKEKLIEIKSDAADEMTKVAEAADREIEEAGAAIKAAKDDAVDSLNSFLKPKSADPSDQE